MRGRRAKPTRAPELHAGGLPRCPPHLGPVARREWRRLARPLFDAGILTVADRAAFAAYCQAYGQWAEAVEMLRKGPALIRTPSGYVQQSPWQSIANKQLELMGRFMAELGITPTSRARLADMLPDAPAERLSVEVVFVSPDGTVTDTRGNLVEDRQSAPAVIDGRH